MVQEQSVQNEVCSESPDNLLKAVADVLRMEALPTPARDRLIHAVSALPDRDHEVLRQYMACGPEAVLELPIECLRLSSRAFNCLHRAGLLSIRDVVQLQQQQDIYRIRGMGVKTANEIARSLRSLDIRHTQWEHFLL